MAIFSHTYRIALMGLVALTGCDFHDWDDVPNSPIRVVDETGRWSDWDGIVRTSVATWERALGEGCPSPFRFSDEPSAHVVKLVDAAAWSWEPNIKGMTLGDMPGERGSIEILEHPEHPFRTYWLQVFTTHELGHALGLEHTDDESGVMFHEPYKLEPSALEVAQVRERLGC